jgi:hypothetical protein
VYTVIAWIHNNDVGKNLFMALLVQNSTLIVVFPWQKSHHEVFHFSNSRAVVNENNFQLLLILLVINKDNKQLRLNSLCVAIHRGSPACSYI